MSGHVFLCAEDLEAHVTYGLYCVRDQGSLATCPTEMEEECVEGDGNEGKK